MKMDGEFRFPYFLFGMAAGAIIGTLLAPRSGEETRKYLRERSNNGLNRVNEQAVRLRAAAEALIETGKKLMACQHQPINTATETDEQAHQEERRDTLGGLK
jgi:gas vesicle protein